MRYYRYLYTGPGIDDTDKIKKSLNDHKGFFRLYVITLSRGKDQLEIINANYLLLEYYRKHPVIVIGLARSYDDAVSIVIDIINESINRIHKVSIKEYLTLRVKKSDKFDDA